MTDLDKEGGILMEICHQTFLILINTINIIPNCSHTNQNAWGVEIYYQFERHILDFHFSISFFYFFILLYLQEKNLSNKY